MNRLELVDRVAACLTSKAEVDRIIGKPSKAAVRRGESSNASARQPMPIGVRAAQRNPHGRIDHDCGFEKPKFVLALPFKGAHQRDQVIQPFRQAAHRRLEVNDPRQQTQI